jgi:hypothetical protein
MERFHLRAVCQVRPSHEQAAKADMATRFMSTRSSSRVAGFFLHLLPFQANINRIRPLERGGALCQSLLCFKKRPLILKQLKF